MLNSESNHRLLVCTPPLPLCLPSSSPPLSLPSILQLISHPGALPGEVIGTYHQTSLGLLSLLPAGSEAALLHLLERSVFLPAMFW